MPFLARVSHQPYLYPLPLRWTTRPGIGKSSDVPIYRMRIEQHAREGFIWMPYRRPEITNVVPPSALIDSHTWCTNTPIINFNIIEWYHGDRVLRQFGCIQPIPDPPCQLREDHGLTKRGRVQLDWGIYHRKYVALWYDRMSRIPQMVMATDLQPSREYTKWYHSRGKPYLLGLQSTIVPPYAQQVRGSEADSMMDPIPTAFCPAEQAEPEQSEPNEESHGYHPDFLGGEHYPSYAEGEYAFDFELFSSPRPQYDMPGPSETYPSHYGTHDGSSSSAVNEGQDIPSIFSTPPPADDEDVGRHPGRQRRPPRRYTPRTTPSNHQM